MDKKSLIISLIVTAIYALFTLNTVLHHEVWADEAQVWQICSNLSLDGLFRHLTNEGHPALFYLMVFPFAKLFSDIIYMKIICWFFMSVAVFLLMYISPFKIYTKLAIILSAGFIYFFPVIARNYSIIPFLVFLAATLYSKSKQHPILYATTLALLANTHIIMFAFCALLGVKLYYDNVLLNIRNKDYKKLAWGFVALGIVTLGLFFVVLELSLTTNSNTFIKFSFDNTILTALKVIVLFFINGYNYDIGLNNTLYSPYIDLLSILTLVVLYIYSFIYLFINSKKLFLLAFLSIGFQFGIYIFAYSSFIYVNRVFCAHLILIFCFWLLLRQDSLKSKLKGFGKKAGNIILTIFFALTIYNGLHYSILDLKMEYSGAKQTAEFIKNNIDPKNSVILIDNEPYMVSLAYYLRDTHKIYSAFRKQNLDYVRWDHICRSNYADLGWSQYISYLSKRDDRQHYMINVSSDIKHFVEKTQTDYFDMIFISGKTIEPYEGYRVFKFIGK